ncbi:MAG: amino acid-binding protein [Lachnospiraceae bacterium]|jgi:hypothetical protein|nr:amino acid-binding protein [Lachnospiraceae bacterium]
MIKQLSVFVDNRPGSLSEITDNLKEAKVDIRAIASFDTPEFAILRLIVDKPEEAKEFLADKGFIVKISDAIGVELTDETGSLNNLLSFLAEADINLNYIYTFIYRNRKAPVLVFGTDEIDSAIKTLKDAGEVLVDHSEL